MPFDGVDIALDDDVENVVIKRKGSPTWSKGVMSTDPEETTSTTVSMNVQPMGAQEAEQIDKEFSRDKTYKKFWSKESLTINDILVYGGLDFKILNLGNWIQHGGFCEAGCVAVVKL